jgi:hypothetical protein
MSTMAGFSGVVTAAATATAATATASTVAGAAFASFAEDAAAGNGSDQSSRLRGRGQQATALGRSPTPLRSCRDGQQPSRVDGSGGVRTSALCLRRWQSVLQRRRAPSRVLPPAGSRRVRACVRACVRGPATPPRRAGQSWAHLGRRRRRRWRAEEGRRERGHPRHRVELQVGCIECVIAQPGQCRASAGSGPVAGQRRASAGPVPGQCRGSAGPAPSAPLGRAPSRQHRCV